MTTIAQELRHAVRALARSGSFTAAALATLALGIGATTAIFSIAYSVLLRPLPFPEPDRVVVPESRNVKTGDTWSVAYADFMDWRDNGVFGQVAVYSQTSMDITGGDQPVRVSAAGVTPQFFGALGVGAAQGRLLQPADFVVGAPYLAVISDRLWRMQFGSRADIVGLEVEVNGIKRPIVGVLPPEARWPLDADLWVPARIASEQNPDLQKRDNFVWQAIARLKPGATIAGTRAAMATLARRVAVAQPDIRGDVSTQPTPVLESLLGDTTPRALWILLASVGLLLLIGCVNVANLQLARAAARQRELAVRTALGASRLRIVRQSLIESAALGVTGGALGLAIAFWMVRSIVALAPPDTPRIAAASLNVPALLFALAVSLGVAFLFGLVPALQAAGTDPHLAMVDTGGTRTAGGRSGTRTRRILVATELALSVVLLVGAGLAVRSVINLQRVDAGFDTRDVLAASISLPGGGGRYDAGSKVVRFMYQLRDRIAAAPGVEAVGISSASPLGGGGFYLGRMMVAEGRDQSVKGEVPINWNVTTPGYFAALRVPIVKGRDFTARDDSASPPVIIVNEKFAHAMFPGDDPIGKRVMSSRDERLMREIVGVVKDVKYYGAADTARGLVWVPYAQRNAWGQGILTVRTRGNPANALPVVRRELKALDPGIALANVMTMEEARSRSMATQRLVGLLLGSFAALALVLAAVGIFGVLSYMMAQRTRELGIRLALGAQRGDVVRLVARETVPVVSLGVGIGLLAALGLGRFVGALLYGVQAGDPATFAVAAAVLGVVGVIAALVPARRASRVDPVVALRE